MAKLWRTLTLIGLTYSLPLLAQSTGEKLNQGLENVKEGSKQTIEGIGAAAKDAGAKASAAAQEAGAKASAAGQKVGRALKSATCPVVGDRSTKLYYAKDSKSYASVLDGQKYFEDDDRACFMSEDAARAEGYARDPN